MRGSPERVGSGLDLTGSGAGGGGARPDGEGGGQRGSGGWAVRSRREMRGRGDAVALVAGWMDGRCVLAVAWRWIGASGCW